MRVTGALDWSLDTLLLHYCVSAIKCPPYYIIIKCRYQEGARDNFITLLRGMESILNLAIYIIVVLLEFGYITVMQ